MKQSHAAYERARQAVLDAQARVPAGTRPGDGLDEDPSPETQALADAHDRLRGAEAAVAGELEAAWQANVDAVIAAKAGVVEALRALGRVEVECGNAARQRSPRHPVLNDDEIARIGEARAAVDSVREALTEAQARHKAGVTADQLEAAST